MHHYVDAARVRQDRFGGQRFGVDETSFRRGQDYVTVFADIAAVLLSSPRRVATLIPTGSSSRPRGSRRRGRADRRGLPGHERGVPVGRLGKYLPAAEITFDRYHVKAQLSKAAYEVRRAEYGELLKHSRYLCCAAPPTSPIVSAIASALCCASR